MNDRVELSEIIAHLKNKQIVSSIKVVSFDNSLQRSICRLRCSLLPSRFKLDIRLIQTEIETIYSYQLFHKRPIVRWDNAPHFPDIETFPHHCHNKKGEVGKSNLIGNILDDIDFVLKEIKRFMIS